MMHAPRIRSLESRHQSIESQIAAEGSRPRPDDAVLTRLKREKLALKEELERLRTSRGH
ncbi:YdcH family protein [Sabulicella rubraurantiaca]|uniref:YdcH family protein n=2 Tax=Sabulicella glaciei TaxID=2984948 RepID=A0ABT3NU20_9PROT|nr:MULTISPECIES: YdcH family protein [Acetobacteraceae]MCW8085662.1 YdcH family protein [Roseococcus sp. MDT2-1-1]